jgi:hypothetical protein
MKTLRIKHIEGNTSFQNIQLQAKQKEGVLILYGNGADLGDFKQFADSLKIEKLKTYAKENIIVEPMQNKNNLFKYLSTFNTFKIAELHVFSHASGGGLYLGYHNTESGQSRMDAYNRSIVRRKRITYEEVVNAEIGALLTDDYFTSKATKLKSVSKNLFISKAYIKFWGCNSGVENWTYSDDGSTYYWSALNEKNVPKPSIAQATANFFHVETFGARSGSHIEFLVEGKWQKFNKQPKNHKGIRLHPDVGNYYSYKPK